MIDKQIYAAAGIGLVLRTVLFALLRQVWLVGASAGAGLLVGAIIDMAWVRQRATKHATATKSAPADGIATAEFSHELRAYGGGSARVRTLREQITRTLTQFSSVREARIAIEARLRTGLSRE